MRHPEITRELPALPFGMVGWNARGSTIVILFLIVVLAIWSVLGYLQWVNDEDPEGVLPRAEAARLASAAEPEVARPQRRPERVVIVLVDGLRADFSRRMRTLGQLAARGVELSVDVGLPSMSRSVYAAMATGTTQERNGIRTNSFHGASTVDDVFSRARAAGLRVACASTLGWWKELFPEGFDRHVVTPQASFEAAALLALEGRYELVLLHTTGVDYAGHQRGGRSEDYRAAVREADATLRALLAEIDLERDAVWVISDHGHRNRGGHGGDEPHVRTVRWVAAGVGVARGLTATLEAAQLGPTLAVLLGTRFPRDAQAPPAFAILDPEVLGGAYLGAREAAFEAQRHGYLEALAAEGEVRFDADEGFEGWREGMLAARLEGRNVRLGLAIAVTLLGFVLILLERREAAWRVVLAGATFAVVYLVGALLTQSALSLSSAEREYRYLLRLMALGLMAFIGQHVVMHWLRVSDWGTVYLLGSWLPAMMALLVYAYYGFPLTAPLPSPMLTFWPVFATLMTFSQAGMGALGLTVLWLTERRWRRRVERATARARPLVGAPGREAALTEPLPPARGHDAGR